MPPTSLHPIRQSTVVMPMVMIFCIDILTSSACIGLCLATSNVWVNQNGRQPELSDMALGKLIRGAKLLLTGLAIAV